MSFFGKLFTRNITFVQVLTRDENYDDILHVFGSVRVMPDEGDSFDIWRHSVIDLNSYQITNGLQQRGNEFSMKSAFAKRCIEQMSAQLNRNLKPSVKEESSDDDDEEFADDNYSEPEPEFANLDDNCELPVTDIDQNDSDTAEPKKLPRTGLVYTKNNIGDRERFKLQLHRSGRGMDVHQMNGMADYFRHILWLRKSNRIVGTYRKENWIGGGGMAFFVLDANTGGLLHNDMIK